MYDGINDPDNVNYKETGMHIGDYVDYTAGSWSEAKAAPTSSEPFTFGGYSAGQSRDTSATGGDMGSGYGYSGWRIWDISEDKRTMTLISAGCPEIYYHPYEMYSASNTEKILTGEQTLPDLINDDYPSTPRVWTDYINTEKYGDSARAMKKSDLDIWYGKYINNSITDSWNIDSFPENATNKLISIVENGYYYWTSSSIWERTIGYYVDPDACGLSYVNLGKRNAPFDTLAPDHAYGIRILVALKSEVGFGETPEKIEHDGFLYNKWIIE